MSSATSIEKPYRLNTDIAGGRGQAKNKTRKGKGPGDERPSGGGGVGAPPEQVDHGFKAWHFFVLASLVMATVAVIMSRQGSPEHLILISFTIAAAGGAAAGFYRTLAPLASEDAALFSEPLSDRSRAALEREKTLVLRSIKELEFDRAMGKLSDKDFDEMAGRLRTRAISLMKELDEGASAYREIIERELNARLSRKGSVAAPATPASLPETAAAIESVSEVASGTCACGTVNDPDAAFCKRCGSRLMAVQS